MNLVSFAEDGQIALTYAISLCKEAQTDTRRQYQVRNFDPDYEDKPWTLLYLLLRDRKFSQPGADYLMMVDRGRALCAAGAYPHSEFCYEGEPVSIVMSRMYTVPSERMHWHGTKILKRLIEQVVTPYCMVTFNEENKGLYLSLTSKNCGLVWPHIWHEFLPLGRQHINSVDQWCAIATTSQLLKYCQ